MPPRKRHQASEASQTLSDAEALVQRGERKKGSDAAELFNQAEVKYKMAMDLELSSGERNDASFGLGWCLQLHAEAVLYAAHTLDDSQINWISDNQAKEMAANLYQQATVAYQQVLEASGAMREDAAVNCGNTFCSLAELFAESCNTSGCTKDPTMAERASMCFQEACTQYRAALMLEEDASTWGNLADCKMSYASLLVDGPLQGRQSEAEVACHEALQAYENSCSMCDSAQGDDLPGLLCNWGCGLLAAAQMTNDLNNRHSLLTQAASRLQHSASFAQADPEPLIRLGDVFVALAELAQQKGELHEAIHLMQNALRDGYGQASAIYRGNVEAQISAADANASLAKLLKCLGDGGAAQQYLSTCLSTYQLALQNPTKLGRFQERCDTRFNYACALAVSGHDMECAALLRQLLECKGISNSELMNDEDLESVKSRPWFQDLMTLNLV